MFKCDKCHKTTYPGEKLTKYPVKYRDKVYQIEYTKYRGSVVTSYGKEIVKEINLCESCAFEINNQKNQN